jgi:hypothetical protein
MSQELSEEKEEKLEEEEEKILRNLISMTGLDQDEILTRLKKERDKIKPLKDALSELKKNRDTFNAINSILSLLGLQRISKRFFNKVFNKINFSKPEEVERAVKRFQWLCMLEFSDILHGYEVFSTNDELLVTAWARHFSPHKRPPTIYLPRLTEIEPRYLFALGYLAYSQSPDVNEARQKLLRIIEEVIARCQRKDAKGSAEEFEAIAKEKFGISKEDLRALCKRASISHGLLLLTYPLGGWMYSKLTKIYKTYYELLIAARNECEQIDGKKIMEARLKGLENFRAYLSAQNIDVYIATSMREPNDFLTNHAFVSFLKESEELKDLNLVFFDPTQAYIPERIHKGILECLMIDRVKVAIYNAQEMETFGKDAEAAISLAHGKPVIIYVARLFGEEIPQIVSNEKEETLNKIKKLYSDIDRFSQLERDDFLNEFEKSNYIDEAEKSELLSPEKDKRDILAYVINKWFPQLLQNLDENYIKNELISKGYSEYPSAKDDLIKYCVEKIVKLETRALLFKDIHPLTFQISPIDGIPRGVFVTRTIRDTAKLLRALFEGTLEYEIKEVTRRIEETGKIIKVLLLVDKITNSPIRACPMDEMIRMELRRLRSKRLR